MQQKLRINQCNHMLDKKRAEMEKSRIYRQKRLEEEVFRSLCPDFNRVAFSMPSCTHSVLVLLLTRHTLLYVS
jgi:hypothetical protein